MDIKKWLLVILFLMTGCGQKNSGTKNAITFNPVDSIFAAGSTSFELVLSSDANACADIANQISHKGGQILDIQLQSSSAVGAGNFVVGDQNASAVLHAAFTTYDSVSCAPSQIGATEGTLSITSLSSSSASGTFAFTFDSNGTIDGGFVATVCTGSKGGTGAPTCQ